MNVICCSFQATFHFKAYKKTAKGRKLLDCSKTLGQPFELLIGKKFKLQIWEEMIKTMRVNEISRFVCDKEVGWHFSLSLKNGYI